ncbi:MAG: DUF4386 domain-containing protein [Rhodanobacter sp.]
MLYLIVIATGIFSLIYVPSQIAVPNDATATVNSILASGHLFRIGMVAGLVCHIAFLLLPFALYKLLSPSGKDTAVLMVAFAVIQTPIYFVNLCNKLDVLSILSGAGYLQAFTTAQLNAKVMLSLAAYGNGMLALEILMGLWLLPFGYLVFKSDFLPKTLGILLMAGCFGYLIDFTGTVLFPGYANMSIASYVTLPATFGEIGICLWLLIVGVRDRPISSGCGDPDQSISQGAH